VQQNKQMQQQRRQSGQVMDASDTSEKRFGPATD